MTDPRRAQTPESEEAVAIFGQILAEHSRTLRVQLQPQLNMAIVALTEAMATHASPAELQLRRDHICMHERELIRILTQVRNSRQPITDTQDAALVEQQGSLENQLESMVSLAHALTSSSAEAIVSASATETL